LASAAKISSLQTQNLYTNLCFFIHGSALTFIRFLNFYSEQKGSDAKDPRMLALRILLRSLLKTEGVWTTDRLSVIAGGEKTASHETADPITGIPSAPPDCGASRKGSGISTVDLLRCLSLTYDKNRSSVRIMNRKPPAATPAPLPTEAELAILNVLWTTGPATVREVFDGLSSKEIGYTTVLKQMQVMFEKGLLERSERFRSHVYSPAIPREQTQQQLAGNLLQRAFNGSAKNLVLGALSSKKISSVELKEIRQILDAFEKKDR
jgi:BlaI family transcriptional regulator, penicillinase repressor